MQRLLFFVVKPCKECFIHLLSGLSNLLELRVPSSCQFHNVTSSVTWVRLSFDEPPLFEGIKEGYHIGTINRQGLRQVLLRCLADGFKQLQNPVVRGVQFPSAEDLRKQTAGFSSQAAQQVGLIGEQALW